MASPVSKFCLLTNLYLFSFLVFASENPSQDNLYEGGILEFSENTDPKILHSYLKGKIGRLYISGDGVYVNDKNVTGPIDVYNGDYIRTNKASAARVVFHRDNKTGCDIVIEEFKHGIVYGNSKDCAHKINLPAVNGDSLTDTTYFVEANPGLVTFNVVEGELEVSLIKEPAKSVIIRSKQLAFVLNTVILGPIDIPMDEMKRKLEWRDKIKYETEGQPKEILSKDKELPAPPEPEEEIPETELPAPPEPEEKIPKDKELQAPSVPKDLTLEVL